MVEQLEIGSTLIGILTLIRFFLYSISTFCLNLKCVKNIIVGRLCLAHLGDETTVREANEAASEDEIEEEGEVVAGHDCHLGHLNKKKSGSLSS